MDRDHELSAVLADDTRYHIYRAIAERPAEDVTVAAIAARFGLHPNVARMHLSKLEQAGFLATGFRRASGGGRPAKLYRLSDLVVTFGFPPRRYELLSRLALESLSAGGSRDDAVRVCREAGAAEGQHALAGEVRAPRDADAAADLVRRVAEEQGLLPEVAWRGDALEVVVNNCTFRELSAADPDLVCAMHRAFLEGVLEVVTAGLGRLRISPGDCRISCGGERCEMLCTFSPDGGGQPSAGR
ncbi:MAG: helix-turn-helix domain-containing protein [Actinobacteria bacterium]|nr:helix-turn-helix domain-containing protein [Actinomycetota bacterium]